jgi:hypothetical protein
VAAAVAVVVIFPQGVVLVTLIGITPAVVVVVVGLHIKIVLRLRRELLEP